MEKKLAHHFVSPKMQNPICAMALVGAPRSGDVSAVGGCVRRARSSRQSRRGRPDGRKREGTSRC
jgi:hypothetical protein